MPLRKSLFRYSGNKGRMLGVLQPPPAGTLRIVEPFLGSGSYTLSYGLPGLGIDADPNVIDLWDFMKGALPEDLLRLAVWWEGRRKFDPPPDLEEVESLFGKGAALYFKINVCGAYVGQWSSTTTYPQHSLPIERTLQALASARSMGVRKGSWEDAAQLLRGGDMVFFDPPYVGTHGNYLREGAFDPSGIKDILLGWEVPILFTYGTGAPEVFPGLPWELAQKRKVPRLRGGGTLEREEWVAYLNWPKREDALSMFGTP
jgi:hypothetical protein